MTGPLERAVLDLHDRLHAELERLRRRTHEIQAEEMAKRAHLDSLIATMRARWDAAKRWTEDNGLLAEWASGEFSTHPWWPMTSVDARDALARMIGERDEARAQRGAALTLHPREVWADESLDGRRVVCGNCRQGDEEPWPWPCPTARALGVEEADRG